MKPHTSMEKEFRFSDFADNISERVEPGATDLNVYVGLEHLDPESIHITRHGTPAEVEGVKLRVYPGDIIFGKRRAYQRKAAIMKTDGICSAHAMVLRAKPTAILPDLFPFFLHSDAFMATAVRISEGSLSPTIKWKTLAEQKFKLPPLTEQKRISDLLWSIERAIVAKRGLQEKLATVYLSSLEEIYGPQPSWEKKKIYEICDVNIRSLSSNTNPSLKFRYLDISSISAPNKIGELKEYLFSEAPSRARRIVSRNSIVLSLVRPYFKSFVVLDTDYSNIIASTGTAVLDVRPSIDYKFIFHAFFTKRFLSFCEQRMSGSNYPAITPTDVREYEISTPPLKEQRTLGARLSQINSIEDSLADEISRLSTLKNGIICHFFK